MAKKNSAAAELQKLSPQKSPGDTTISLRVLVSIALGIGLTFIVVVLGTIRDLSPTFDEPVHVLAGYSYLKWGDYRVNPEHPPLAKALAGLQLLAVDIKDPRPGNSDWDRIPKQQPGIPTVKFARELLFVHNDGATLFKYAKLPFVILTVILGLFVFLWSLQWFGPVAAVASLALFATDPNIIAHGSLVHTDMPFTVFFFIGTYFFQRVLSTRRWSDGLVACALFALAAITKFSSIGIMASWSLAGLIWLLHPASSQDSEPADAVPRSRKLLLLSGILLGSVLITYLFTWAAYGFRFAAIPGTEASFVMAPVIPETTPLLVRKAASFVARFHLLPEAWIYGELHTLAFLSRTSFLLGEFSEEGFWLYFPVAFLAKTPLPTLILVLLSIVGLLTRRYHHERPIFTLWAPVLVYFSIAVWARMNIGIRHILPIYPFLFVLAGESAAALWNSRTAWKRACLVLIGGWALWGSLATYPNYISYFNEAAGGPKNGHNILLDSNLDWGQNLKSLKSWMDEHGVKSILLLYFGQAEPASYGIDAIHIPGSLIRPRTSKRSDSSIPYVLAVSLNHFYAAQVYSTRAEADFIRSFRLKEPVATIGHSILVFKLDPADPQTNYTLGTIMALRGEPSIAEELFRKVLEVAPSSARVHEALAQVLALQQKLTEAEYHYKQALAIYRSQAAPSDSR
jgi:tetratricopeptide (TPR) repeat protein